MRDHGKYWISSAKNFFTNCLAGKKLAQFKTWDDCVDRCFLDWAYLVCQGESQISTTDSDHSSHSGPLHYRDPASEP